MLTVMTHSSAPSTVELAPGVHALDYGTSTLTVEVIPGVIEVPRYVLHGWMDEDHDFEVIVRCHEDGPSCHELTVRRSVTGEVLRGVPVASIVRGVVWRNLLRRNTEHGGEPRYLRYEVPDLTETTEGEVLRTVDEVYRVAAYVGDAPRRAVATALGVSDATAGRRITAARNAGLLDVHAPATGRGGRIYQGD